MKFSYTNAALRLLIVLVACIGFAVAIVALAPIVAPILQVQEGAFRIAMNITVGAAWGWYSDRLMDYFHIPPVWVPRREDRTE